MPSLFASSRWLALVGLTVLVVGCKKKVPDPESAGAAPAMVHTGAPLTDQRGLSRVINGALDIGAFEVQSLAPYFTACPGNLTTNRGRSANTSTVKLQVSVP